MQYVYKSTICIFQNLFVSSSYYLTCFLIKGSDNWTNNLEFSALNTPLKHWWCTYLSEKLGHANLFLKSKLLLLYLIYFKFSLFQLELDTFLHQTQCDINSKKILRERNQTWIFFITTFVKNTFFSPAFRPIETLYFFLINKFYRFYLNFIGVKINRGS